MTGGRHNPGMDIHASDILVAGGGIAGLAAALALSRRGADVQLIEQADAFSEVGAGIQIGPNVTRILRDWGLEAGLRQVASFPHELIARDARSGRELGSLPLGELLDPVVLTIYAGCALVLVGCGPDVQDGDVTADVTLDGQPLKEGMIRFVPADGKTAAKDGPIANGKFTGPSVSWAPLR